MLYTSTVLKKDLSNIWVYIMKMDLLYPWTVFPCPLSQNYHKLRGKTQVWRYTIRDMYELAVTTISQRWKQRTHQPFGIQEWATESNSFMAGLWLNHLPDLPPSNCLIIPGEQKLKKKQARPQHQDFRPPLPLQSGRIIETFASHEGTLAVNFIAKPAQNLGYRDHRCPSAITNYGLNSKQNMASLQRRLTSPSGKIW